MFTGQDLQQAHRRFAPVSFRVHQPTGKYLTCSIPDIIMISAMCLEKPYNTPSQSNRRVANRVGFQLARVLYEEEADKVRPCLPAHDLESSSEIPVGANLAQAPTRQVDREK